jgi:3-methyladenine DNA glycosylase AlkD
MVSQETQDKLKEIRSSFRLLMNGPVSQSMRDKGIDYKINWGVPLMELKRMSTEYGKDYDLAIELWKDHVRECKLLATMIMPVDKMLPEITDIWMESVDNQELVEQLVFNLLQYVSYAPVIAYQWMAENRPYYQITAYHILSRLFMNGQQPNERGINEFLDQVGVALQSNQLNVKHAAANCVQRFAQLGEVYKRMAKSALKDLIEIF